MCEPNTNFHFNYENEVHIKGIEHIEDGEKLGDFIDAVYNYDAETMKFILDNITISKVLRLINNDDKFLIRAAKKLSYPSLAFLINLGQAQFLCSKFTKNSKILQTFVENLKIFAIDKNETQRILIGLVYFNDKAVEEVISNTGNKKLIRQWNNAKEKVSASGNKFSSIFILNLKL